MTITINTKVFKQNRTQPDSIAYSGPTNSLSVSDLLTFKRVMPKPTATFRGVGRPTIKRSKDVVIDTVTNATKPAVLEVSGSFPVGMTESDILDMAADVAAAIASASGQALLTDLDLPSV